MYPIVPQEKIPDPPKKGMIDPIWLWHPKLVNKRCSPVTAFDETLDAIVSRMYGTMGYYGGIGLAAPQIGIFQKIALISYQDHRLCLVNPEIVSSRGQANEFEACLSLPGCTSHGGELNNRGKVNRATEVVLRWWTPARERKEETFLGYVAHAIQHEIDHLEGLFFIDRCGDMARNIVLDKYRNFRRLKFSQDIPRKG